MTLLEKFFNLKEFSFDQIYLGDCSEKNFKGVDDPPYGGGPGVVIRPDVLKVALEKAFYSIFPKGNFESDFKNHFKVIYTSPRGKIWDASVAKTFAEENLNQSDKHIVFINGRYEGIDERFIAKYVDEIFSLGDYVLMGGELAFMIILESSIRFIPGVLGGQDSALEDSFESSSIEFPQYTRPAVFEGVVVPEVLTSGDHQKIKEYRLMESERLTKLYRPDLIKNKVNK